MSPATAVERLARYLHEEADTDGLADELAGWLAASAPFRRFAEAHRDKIRKKLRRAGDVEARRDVRTELRTARLLLADRRIQLAFEAYGSTMGGPDFTVSFRGQPSFNLEVTRLRGSPEAATYGGPLLAKLRQLPPSVPNTVLIAIEGRGAAALDVAAATRALRTRADAKDDGFFAGRGFGGSRGFYQCYLRLGAVLVACEDAAGEAGASLWTNASARIAAPERALRACLACLRGG